MFRQETEVNSGEAGKAGFKVRWYWIIFGVLWIAGIVTLLIVFRHRIANVDEYGYLGAFFVSLVASATVVFMIPSVPVMFALGAILNPFFVALAAAAGETIGESTAYLAGRTGSAFIIKTNPADNCGPPTGIYARLQGWMRVKGSLALFLSAAMFNPFMSVVGATAGALRMPPWKFYLVVFAGKSVKWMIVAIAGQALLRFILDWFGLDLFPDLDLS